MKKMAQHVTIDVGKTANDIITALNGVLNGDIETNVPFINQQTTALANQAQLIAEQTVAGALDEQQRKFFLDHLEKHTKDLALIIAALTILTAEKAWNAIMGVLWGAINTAVSAALGGVQVALPKLIL
jgi:hypothetical protein